MDFSLAIGESFGVLSPAEQKLSILATNSEAFTYYGLKLTPDDAEMLLSTVRRSLEKEQLVQFGEGITKYLIHWFLPSGEFGTNYALRISELTEAFYRLKGELQTLYDEADDPDCMLSDFALLDYMYRFYTSPQCGCDCDEMLAQMERIVVAGMRRLLEYRTAKLAKRKAVLGDPEKAALYADQIRLEEEKSRFEEELEEVEYDYMYRETMHQDMFGNYLMDYETDHAKATRGDYAEELSAALQRNPELLLPSKTQEAEWLNRAEEWDALDEAAQRAAQRAAQKGAQSND